jgi:hypothetical protein
MEEDGAFIWSEIDIVRSFDEKCAQGRIPDATLKSIRIKGC